MHFTKDMIEAAGGDWETASTVNDDMDKLRGQCVSVLPLSGDLRRSKVAWKVAVLRQSLTYRLVDLGDATISQWQESNSLACIVLARSFWETVAVVHYTAMGTRKAIDAKDLTEVNRLAMQLSFGGKHRDWRLGDWTAVNVLTALDHMSRVLPPVRDFYEKMSEIAHPNSQGAHQFYSETNKELIETTFSRQKRGQSEILENILAALWGASWSLLMLNETDKMIREIADLQNPE